MTVRTLVNDLRGIYVLLYCTFNTNQTYNRKEGDRTKRRTDGACCVLYSRERSFQIEQRLRVILTATFVRIYTGSGTRFSRKFKENGTRRVVPVCGLVDFTCSMFFGFFGYFYRVRVDYFIWVDYLSQIYPPLKTRFLPKVPVYTQAICPNCRFSPGYYSWHAAIF